MKVHFGRYPKDHTKERILRVKVDGFDVWGADHTLAMIIHPVLVKLKEQKHGSPHVADEDVPEHLRSGNPPLEKTDVGLKIHSVEMEEDREDLVHKRWDWALDEMIWAFGEHIKDDTTEEFGSGEHDFKFVKLEDGSGSRMVQGPNHTWKFDYEGAKLKEKRMTNGRRLFALHFSDLWE